MVLFSSSQSRGELTTNQAIIMITRKHLILIAQTLFLVQRRTIPFHNTVAPHRQIDKQSDRQTLKVFNFPTPTPAAPRVSLSLSLPLCKEQHQLDVCLCGPQKIRDLLLLLHSRKPLDLGHNNHGVRQCVAPAAQQQQKPRILTMTTPGLIAL